MRQTRLLAVLLLLLLFLAVQHAAVAWPFIAEQYQTVDPSRNGDYISISASRSDGGELDGGYGAVIEAKVAPAVGAPYWSATGSVDVEIESVKYTITVKVFYINPSTGLGRWETLATLSDSTYQPVPYKIEGYLDTRDVELRKYHSWTLPSSGDYPAKVRVEFSLSASGYVKPALTSGSAQAGGGALISASRKSGTGTVLPLAQLSVSSTPVSVTISYSGTVSGSATTPFTLYGVGKDLSVTLTAPRAAQHCVWVMLTVAP
ncbi:MAG: hypothetical protein LM563_06475 [Thermofilum sp.]|nr:hypothetical protein [Thermofilum sp.]